MRARAKTLVAVSLLSLGSVLAALACSNANGTFSTPLPYYDPDAGYVAPPEGDSGTDAATDGPVSAADGGDSGAKGDAGDASVHDAATDSGDASVGDAAGDSGDSGEPSDAADSGG